MLFEWSDDYATGVCKFDNQHKRLFEMLRQLQQGIKEKKTKEKMGEVLDGLVEYTLTHFLQEEVEMRRHGYVDFEKHKEEHDKFVAQVRDFHSAFHSGDAILTTNLLAFISDWLVHHIGGTDKKYAPFFKKHGIE